MIRLEKLRHELDTGVYSAQRCSYQPAQSEVIDSLGIGIRKTLITRESKVIDIYCVQKNKVAIGSRVLVGERPIEDALYSIGWFIKYEVKGGYLVGIRKGIFL
ncbi:MAG: hypothetical protein ABJG47_14685 [Ekhidna sp.]